MTNDERIFELLESINQKPGLTAGELLARCPAVSEKTFRPAIQDMKKRGLIVTTGMKEKTEYHLTDSGRCSLECGELPIPKAAQQDAEQETTAELESADSTEKALEDIPVFGALPEVTAGIDEVVAVMQECEPLPVFNSDKTTLDEALGQLKELAAEIDRPSNLLDLIIFNRRGADLVRKTAPVAAALMESSANALERAYCKR